MNLPNKPTDQQAASFATKAMLALTTASLALSVFFLGDVYERYATLEERQHSHELEAESRLTALETRQNS